MKKVNGLLRRWYMLRDILGLKSKKCNYKTAYCIIDENETATKNKKEERIKSENELSIKFNKITNELFKLAEQYPPQNIDDYFDRVYIKRFLEENSEYISNAKNILEFYGIKHYAKDFNKNADVKYLTYRGRDDIFKTTNCYNGGDYYGDLRDISTLPEEKFDCVIATQVMMYDILKVKEYVAGLKYMLKPNGVLLITLPASFIPNKQRGIEELFFTEKGLESVLLTQFDKENINIKTYGNINYHLYTLFMLKHPDVDFINDLINDKNYPVIICARCFNNK